MTLTEYAMSHAGQIALWGLLATGAMTATQETMRLSGLSRMSLPLLFGTALSGNRVHAVVLGYVAYLLGGWVFAVLYALALESAGAVTWWAGLLLGGVHGLFLVAVLLPTLPFIHPRLASDYDGPRALAELEPPGPFGLNYGRATPVAVMLSQIVYGVVLGGGLWLAGG